jgi:hypothetical protein
MSFQQVPPVALPPTRTYHDTKDDADHDVGSGDEASWTTYSSSWSSSWSPSSPSSLGSPVVVSVQKNTSAAPPPSCSQHLPVPSSSAPTRRYNPCLKSSRGSSQYRGSAWVSGSCSEVVHNTPAPVGSMEYHPLPMCSWRDAYKLGVIDLSIL